MSDDANNQHARGGLRKALGAADDAQFLQAADQD
jgi:hypothetical protein